MRGLRVELLVAAAVIFIAAQASAQTTTFTFDTSSSFQHNGSHNYNPPPIAAEFDYGGTVPSTNHTVDWSPNESTFTNTPGSGSMKLNWIWSHTVDGDNAAAFIVDTFASPAPSISNVSFDIMVDPSSTADAFGGYGYFEVITRNNDAYDYNKVGNFNQELANPSYGSPVSPGPGVWQHISIPLTGVNAQPLRAFEFQDYNDAGRNMNGPETIYIDNLTFTAVPEPTALALIALAVPAFVAARRRLRSGRWLVSN
jgi:hypothetical protein